MRKIIAIAWKDTIIRFISPSELLFFIILPLFFTFLLTGGTGTYDDNRIRLLVVDDALTPSSANLVTALEKSTTVRPEIMEGKQAEKEFDDAEASALFNQQRVTL